MEQHDVVIIGAGHNALVTAFYLAKAGLKPLVLERRSAVGGVAATEEFFPGFKVSPVIHSAGPLDARLAADLRLDQRGLEWLRAEPSVFAPLPTGRSLILYSDLKKSAAAIAEFSKKDADRFAEFDRVLGQIAKVTRPILSEAPPAIDQPGKGDLWSLFKIGRKLRGLGKNDMYRLLRWAPMPVADLAAEWFETEALRSVIAARGIFATFAGTRSPGTSAVFLLRAALDPHPVGEVWFAKGGMGSFSQALAAAATEAGAEIRTGAEVSRINTNNGTVAGVVLSTREEIAATFVVSGADPKRTLLQFVGPAHLGPDMALKARNFRSTGTVAKVNLALSELPSFTALGNISAAGRGDSALSGKIHIGAALEDLERAFDNAKYGGFSRPPWLEAVIPSILDPSLAPHGKHVMSIYVQYAHYKLKNATWNEQREAFADSVIETLSQYAPNLPGIILHRQVLTPLDLEQTYGLTGGHLFHGEPSLDQLFTMRPLLGWARYRTPIRGLYLCGSGTHPGVGLSGLSGSNAAREIARGWRNGK